MLEMRTASKGTCPENGCEIHKPLPVVLQKSDQEEKQLSVGTMGCPETSGGSPEGDWHKLDSPVGLGRSLLPLADVKQHLQGKGCFWPGHRPLPAPASEMDRLSSLLAKLVYFLLWTVLPNWHNLTE